MTQQNSIGGPRMSTLTGLDMSNIRLCPAIAFNKIVGGRYKLHIICALHGGPQRFGALGRSLVRGSTGNPITPRVLSRELKEMAAAGLILRHDHGVVPRRVDYQLSERGRALLPILSEIIRWGATGTHEVIMKEINQPTCGHA